MNTHQKLVVPGGSGFLGRILAKWFADRRWDVVILTRRLQKSHSPVRTVFWDGKTLDNWKRELEGAEAVVNLAGRSVNCRYHSRNRKTILDSRFQSTQVIGAAIQSCNRPPKVWLNSSTATIYKHSFDQPMDETTGQIGATPEAKDKFSIEVAQAWEKALEEAVTPKTGKVAMRTAMVLSLDDGGVFQVLSRLTHWGLGGTMGHGRQFVFWIHQEDFCRAVEWLIDHDEFSGPVNLAAPVPLPNRDMMRQFRKVYGVPFGLPAVHWMLEVGTFLMQTETELVIKSRRVIPQRLLASGFDFRFSELETVLHKLLKQ
jgi:uncharacterized protein (TIGR01777 family)